MAGFAFKLELEDGTPADRATLSAAVPNWRPGDTIHLGQGRTLRVIATRLDEGPDGEGRAAAARCSRQIGLYVVRIARGPYLCGLSGCRASPFVWLDLATMGCFASPE